MNATLVLVEFQISMRPDSDESGKLRTTDVYLGYKYTRKDIYVLDSTPTYYQTEVVAYNIPNPLVSLKLERF